jgi:hypothetical protein
MTSPASIRRTVLKPVSTYFVGNRHLMDVRIAWMLQSSAENERPIRPCVRTSYPAFEFLMSQSAKHIVKEEGIILLDYRALQVVWRGK